MKPLRKWLFGGTVPPNNMHAGGTVPPNNTHAGGTVPPNNTNPGICYSDGPLKIQRATQNIVKHVSADATVQWFCP